MDLLNILINPDKIKDVCCLCYKKNENTTNLDGGIEIHDELFDTNSTLRNLMKSLFPSHEVLLPQMCEDCSTVIVKIFCLLQRSFFKNEMLSYLVDNLEEEMDEMDCKFISGSRPKKCRLIINVPTSKYYKDSRKNKNFQCDKCLMKFKSKLLVKTHIQMAHNNTNNAIVCDVCGKLFSKNSLLKAHLGCHEQKQCPFCYKVFKSHSHFNVHLKAHTSQTNIKRKNYYYDCNQCDYRSLNKCTLEAHINKVHLKIKPFTCETCQKGFYKKDNLSQHLK